MRVRRAVGGQADTTHEIDEAGVGAERVQEKVYIERDDPKRALRARPFQPADGPVVVAKTGIGPYQPELAHVFLVRAGFNS